MTLTPLEERTPMGTLIRKEWNPGFYREVLRVEKTSHRAICAAEKKDFNPCRSKPFDKYGGHCPQHRVSPLTGEPVDTPPTNTTGLQVTDVHTDLKIISRKQLYMNFPRCNNCPLRGGCELNTPDYHCKVMEDNFFTFIDSIRYDYDLTNLDLTTLYNGALRWAKAMYLSAIENNWSPTEDESIVAQVASVRQSKEFRSCMKDLGLTRAERMKARRDAAQVSIEAAQMKKEVDLSMVMAGIAEKSMMELAELAKRNNPSKDDVHETQS